MPRPAPSQLIVMLTPSPFSRAENGAGGDALAEELVHDGRAGLDLLALGVFERFTFVVHEERHVAVSAVSPQGQFCPGRGGR